MGKLNVELFLQLMEQKNLKMMNIPTMRTD